MAIYAKLVKGLKSYTTQGYSFKKGIALEVKKEDIERLIQTGRVQVFPEGVRPKDDVQGNPDGIIGMEEDGKKGKIVTKKEGGEEIFDEVLKAEEEVEIQKIKDKYKKKQDEYRKTEKERILKEKKSLNDIEKDLLPPEGEKGAKDVTDKKYIKDKAKQKK